MKAYLIKASAKGAFKDYKRSMGGPPQNIFSTAAATPDDVALEMTDETVDMRVNFRTDADVIAIFMSTPDALRAYEIADRFRRRNKVVVLGGLHTSALPEEALSHADAVMIGETEGIWEALLEDVKRGCLQPRYQRTEPIDLSCLNPYPTDLIPADRYEGVWSVVVSRGCPYRCNFCTVPSLLGKIRYRPVDDVIAEIKACGCQYVELHADNLLIDREYAETLFNALIPLGITWMGETSINLARDEALLALAAKSGLKYVLIGLETPSKSVLKETGKTFVKPEQVKEKIALFTQHGVEVDSSFIFGFDENTSDIFNETYDYVRQIGIQSIHSVLLIPFPGTPVYRQLEAEGRILTRDWSKYDGVHAVFQPKQMSVETLESGAYWFHRQINQLKKGVVDRDAKASRNRISLADAVSTVKWKTLLAMLFLAVAMWMGWSEAWGLLFLFWCGVAIRNREAFLVERIRYCDSPILFVIIVGFWSMAGLFTLIWQGDQLTASAARLLAFLGG